MAIPGPSSPPPSLQRMGAAAPPVRSSKQTAVDLSAASQNRMKKVAINNARLRNVVERLELHFRGGVVLGLSELFNLVFSFARFLISSRVFLIVFDLCSTRSRTTVLLCGRVGRVVRL